MNLPVKISPCPILDSTIELRFESKIPSEAVFGVVYSLISASRQFQIEKLPILQLPEEVRTKDPNLIFQPHYRLKEDNFIVAIGPKVLALACAAPYPGWAEFSDKVRTTLDKIIKGNVMSRVLRLGLRYINFFDNSDVFDNIKLNVSLEGDSLAKNDTVVNTQIINKPFTTRLIVANNANVTTGVRNLSGSVIDIDVAVETGRLDILKYNHDLLEKTHNEEKRVFFSLLNESFLNQLNPEY